MSSPREQFATYLENNGRRLHSANGRVVDLVFSLRGLFGVEELVTRLDGEVTRPNVYRTLMNLVDAEMIWRFKVDGQTVYVAGAI